MQGSMTEDLVSVDEAAALLAVEPQLIWNRIRDGTVRFSTLLTANGITYLVDRHSLFPENAVVHRPQPASRVPVSDIDAHGDARLEAFMQRLLDPLAIRLETVSIELGRERKRREVAEREIQDLERR